MDSAPVKEDEVDAVAQHRGRVKRWPVVVVEPFLLREEQGKADDAELYRLLAVTRRRVCVQETLCKWETVRLSYVEQMNKRYNLAILINLSKYTKLLGIICGVN